MDAYLGDFSSKQGLIKINFTEEDGTLIINATGPVGLDDKGTEEFTLDQTGLVLQFVQYKDLLHLSKRSKI
jgi:hypothetical protein